MHTPLAISLCVAAKGHPGRELPTIYDEAGLVFSLKEQTKTHASDKSIKRKLRDEI